MDGEIEQLLQRVRSGRTTPDDALALEKHLTSDSMIPEVRNRLAYNHHIQKHDNAGIHAHVDLNDFGIINKRYGDHVGDQAITHAGKVIAELGKKHGGRVFRSGGDEFKLWFLEPHHAENFADELRESLSLHGAFAGDHQLSASVGIGHSRERAESALLEAKKEIKRDLPNGGALRSFAVGKAPTVIRSALFQGTPEGWKTGEDSIKATKLDHPHQSGNPNVPTS